MDVKDLLEKAISMHASDLHIVSGSVPVVRVNGELRGVGIEKLDPEMTKKLVYSIMTEKHRTIFERDWELDFSIGISGMGRFRVNAHRQRGSIEAAFRVINPGVPALEDLGLPYVLVKLCRKKTGLVLIIKKTILSQTFPCLLSNFYLNCTKRKYKLLLFLKTDFIIY